MAWVLKCSSILIGSIHNECREQESTGMRSSQQLHANTYSAVPTIRPFPSIVEMLLFLWCFFAGHVEIVVVAGREE